MVSCKYRHIVTAAHGHNNQKMINYFRLRHAYVVRGGNAYSCRFNRHEREFASGVRISVPAQTQSLRQPGLAPEGILFGRMTVTYVQKV